MGLQDRVDSLYARHIEEATRLAFLLTGEREAAEDLAQDAFIKAVGRFQDLWKPDAFSAYLMKTVVNECRSLWRRRQVERRYLPRSTEGPLSNNFQDEFVDRLEIMAALKGLTPRQRTAVVLRHYTDLSESTPAELMGCSVGTVKTLTSRGLASLRERINHE